MNEIAKALLDINAVKLNTEELFTWTSGIKSPIYTDNRVIMSFVEQRNTIYKALAKKISDEFGDVEVVAGTAVAGIAPCAFAADYLSKPMVFVRSEAKKHGTQRQIEGEIAPRTKVVIVEDLVSTGKSLKAVIDALNEADMDIVGIVSIFTYNLNKSKELFASYGVEYRPLCTIDELLEYSLEANKLNADQVEVVKNFRDGLNG